MHVFDTRMLILTSQWYSLFTSKATDVCVYACRDVCVCACMYVNIWMLARPLNEPVSAICSCIWYVYVRMSTWAQMQVCTYVNFMCLLGGRHVHSHVCTCTHKYVKYTCLHTCEMGVKYTCLHTCEMGVKYTCLHTCEMGARRPLHTHTHTHTHENTYTRIHAWNVLFMLEGHYSIYIHKKYTYGMCFASQRMERYIGNW
jgi:hypothetical protein